MANDKKPITINIGSKSATEEDIKEIETELEEKFKATKNIGAEYIMNAHLLKLFEYRNSPLITSLLQTFKSYAGYKFIVINHYKNKNDDGVSYGLSIFKHSPAIPKGNDYITKTLSNDFGLEIDGKPHSLFLHRSGMFCFDSLPVLEALLKTNKTIDELLELYFVCQECDNKILLPYYNNFTVDVDTGKPICKNCKKEDTKNVNG